ncbi:MAG: hypothetical protein RIK87_05310 [Fuerstiella sp.]
MSSTRLINHLRANEVVESDRVSVQTVETFRGATSELQAFVESTWSEAYTGRMTFPVWSEQYFDWQLGPRGDEPDRRLAVIEDGRPVAVLLGAPCYLQTPTATFHGSNWSWLSVAKTHRGRGLAKTLDEARVDLERRDDSELIVSFRYTGSRHSLAERPSQRFPLKRFHSRRGFWARPLHGNRLHRWNLNRTEGLLSRLATPLMPRAKWLAVDGIRLFDRGDLEACQEAAVKQFEHCVLRVRWDTVSLRHQLSESPISQTVVAEHGGKVRGFVNFHILPFQARTREPVAVIDLICVNQLPARRQAALLTSALGLMREQGAILALKLRSGDVSSALMLATGFTPRLPDSNLVLQWTQSVRPTPRHKPIHLLWR